ncbi:MAG TPA: hypothetical protein VIL16_03380 [Trebonia sp.]
MKIMKISTRRRRLTAAALAAASAVAIAGVLAAVVPAGANTAPSNNAAARTQNSGAATGLGQLSGLLPTNQLTEESAIQVNLSNESVRLPLYPGIAYKGTRHGPSAPGQFAESWVDMLFVKGFDAGQPIVYLSTDAGQPLTAVLERSTYVPALDSAAFNGGDDFLGSARERLFGFINGQTGANNPHAQGFQHLALDGSVSEDASASNTAFILAAQRRRPAERVRRLPHPDRPTARRRLQPAVGRPARPVDAKGGQRRAEQAADRRGPGVQPGRHPPRPVYRRQPGQPQPYGSVGVDINCAVIGWTNQAPTANLANPVPLSQFPPR